MRTPASMFVLLSVGLTFVSLCQGSTSGLGDALNAALSKGLDNTASKDAIGLKDSLLNNLPDFSKVAQGLQEQLQGAGIDTSKILDRLQGAGVNTSELLDRLHAFPSAHDTPNRPDDGAHQDLPQGLADLIQHLRNASHEIDLTKIVKAAGDELEPFIQTLHDCLRNASCNGRLGDLISDINTTALHSLIDKIADRVHNATAHGGDLIQPSLNHTLHELLPQLVDCLRNMSHSFNRTGFFNKTLMHDLVTDLLDRMHNVTQGDRPSRHNSTTTASTISDAIARWADRVEAVIAKRADAIRNRTNHMEEGNDDNVQRLAQLLDCLRNITRPAGGAEGGDNVSVGDLSQLTARLQDLLKGDLVIDDGLKHPLANRPAHQVTGSPRPLGRHPTSHRPRRMLQGAA